MGARRPVGKRPGTPGRPRSPGGRLGLAKRSAYPPSRRSRSTQLSPLVIQSAASSPFR